MTEMNLLSQMRWSRFKAKSRSSARLMLYLNVKKRDKLWKEDCNYYMYLPTYVLIFLKANTYILSRTNLPWNHNRIADKLSEFLPHFVVVVVQQICHCLKVELGLKWKRECFISSTPEMIGSHQEYEFTFCHASLIAAGGSVLLSLGRLLCGSDLLQSKRKVFSKNR